MMKLYYYPGACSLAPHIVMEWIGEPYELEKVTFGDPAYLELNPLGAVPAMIDGESRAMTQCAAILKYLAEKYPGAKLGDDGTLTGRFEMNQWMAFLTGDFHPAFVPFFVPHRFTTSKEDAAVQAVREASNALVHRVMDRLDRHLEGRENVVGDRRTVADAYAYTMARWSMSLPKSVKEYPNLYRHFQALDKDDGVRRALAKEGIE